MDWLEQLKSEMLEISKTTAYEYFPAIGAYTEPYYNLRFEHTKQVEAEAMKLLKVYGGDADIVLASVWIHDRCKPQFGWFDHGSKAADWTLENLESKGFPQEKIKAVEYAVRNHCGYDKRPLDTLEAQILWDADKLSHRGPGYLFQTFFVFTSEKICNNDKTAGVKFEPTIALENVMPALLQMKTEIDYDAPNPYHLEESRKISIEKIKAVNAFLETLERQL